MTAIETVPREGAEQIASTPSRQPTLPALRSWALGLALPLVLAIGWELAVHLGFSNGRLLPPPSRIFLTFQELWASGELSRHILATCARVAAGFGLGVFAGTLIGAAAGYSGIVNRLIDPTLQGLRSIPSIAWIPLFILWLGIFETSKVALIAVGVFFPVYLGVMGAIVSVDRKIVEVGRIFRLSGPALVRRILLPAILPAYVLALRPTYLLLGNIDVTSKPRDPSARPFIPVRNAAIRSRERDILDHPELEALYAPASAQIAPGAFLNYYRLRSTAAP